MKKIISIITVAALLMAMTVTAFAFPDPSGDKSAWRASNNFTPQTYTADKAEGAINVDAAAAVDSAYGPSVIEVCGYTEEQLLEPYGASGEAHVAWDEHYLYIHLTVDDETKGIGGGFTADSVEIYLDYDQTADGKKVKWNKLSSPDTFAAQYRVQRGQDDDSLEVSVCGNSVMSNVGSESVVAIAENGDSGYIVEVKMPLKDEDGDYIPVSNTIGFELQINDSTDGKTRQSAAYIQGDIQYWAYEYSHLFDNLVLGEGAGLTWSSRVVKTAINDKLATFDPNSVYVPSKTPSKASSAASKATSSKAASSKATSSKASSVAASVASTVSTLEQVVSGTVSDETKVESNVVADNNDVDANANNETNTIGAEDKGGLPLPALIGIIAGGVLILAGAAVAVILIIKKKGAAPADAEATEATEEAPAEETAEEPTEE